MPGFAGGEFVAPAGRGYAAAGCAPGVAHLAEQHTFSGAAHTPIGNTDQTYQICMVIWQVVSN